MIEYRGRLKRVQTSLSHSGTGLSSLLFRLQIDERWVYCQPRDFEGRSYANYKQLNQLPIGQIVTAGIVDRSGRPCLAWIACDGAGYADDAEHQTITLAPKQHVTPTWKTGITALGARIASALSAPVLKRKPTATPPIKSISASTLMSNPTSASVSASTPTSTSASTFIPVSIPLNLNGPVIRGTVHSAITPQTSSEPVLPDPARRLNCELPLSLHIYLDDAPNTLVMEPTAVDRVFIQKSDSIGAVGHDSGECRYVLALCNYTDKTLYRIGRPPWDAGGKRIKPLLREYLFEAFAITQYDASAWTLVDV